MTTIVAPPLVSWSITEVEGGGWQLWTGDPSDPEPVGDPCPSYAAALEALASDASAAADTGEETGKVADGLLPEPWTSPSGIAFSTPTGDGRDFSNVSWSWRDPGTALLPLMFQDQTDMGHFGAKLAGFISTLSLDGGTVHAEGRFYENDVGSAARDLLLDGRRFGVSVDPGSVDASWECVTEDEDGWCLEERIEFGAYEIIGLTMTPFPAFADASIELANLGAVMAVAAPDHAFTDSNGDERCDACLAEDEDGNCTEVCDLTEDEHDAQETEEEASVVVVAAAPVRPPVAWYRTGEPEVGSDLLVDQGDGTWACPLTISDDGRVFGHVARWGQCHVGYSGACVSPPESTSRYAAFHVGHVVTAEGIDLPTGTLTIGTDHAPGHLRADSSRDHYAHTGQAWADVRVINGIHGPWACGALRPDVTPELLRVLRGSTLSGDWRGGELCAVLAVNTPGFPIIREALVAAAMFDPFPIRTTQARIEGGQVTTLVAAGQVRRCPECARRSLSPSTSPSTVLSTVDRRILVEAVSDAVRGATEDLRTALAAIEVRTRHLRSVQASATRARTRKIPDHEAGDPGAGTERVSPRS